MALDQRYLPIVFLIRAPFTFGLPVPIPPVIFGNPDFIVRPGTLNYTRPARGTIVNTAGDAFLDDFGIGVARIFMQGNTGWDRGFSGLGALEALRLLFVGYEEARRIVAASGLLDPNDIELWLIDALNAEAWSVYINQFVVERVRGRGALLYNYRLQMTGLKDLRLAGVGAIADFLNITPSATGNVLSDLAGLFS